MTRVRVIALLDTAAWFNDTVMNNAGWESLNQAIDEGSLRLAISEISVLELTRQVLEKTEELNRAYTKLRRSVIEHAISIIPIEPASANRFEQDFRTRLSERKIQVLPISNVSHADLVTRDLSRKKPFDDSGRGYRDALIWQSFVEWTQAQRSTGLTRAIFVSANKGDFGNGGETLHADLRSDLPSDLDVVYYRSLGALIQHIRATSFMRSKRAEQYLSPDLAGILRGLAQTEFRGLENRLLEDLPAAEPYPDLPEFAELTILRISIDPASFDFRLADSTGAVDIWEISADGAVFVQGTAHRTELNSLSRGWTRDEASSAAFVEISNSFRAQFSTDIKIRNGNAMDDPSFTSVVLRDQL